MLEEVVAFDCRGVFWNRAVALDVGVGSTSHSTCIFLGVTSAASGLAPAGCLHSRCTLGRHSRSRTAFDPAWLGRSGSGRVVAGRRRGTWPSRAGKMSRRPSRRGDRLRPGSCRIPNATHQIYDAPADVGRRGRCATRRARGELAGEHGTSAKRRAPPMFLPDVERSHEPRRETAKEHSNALHFASSPP